MTESRVGVPEKSKDFLGCCGGSQFMIRKDQFIRNNSFRTNAPKKSNFPHILKRFLSF